MKADRHLPQTLTLTGQALDTLEDYLSHGWKLACYSWGYAFIIKAA